MRIGIAMLGEVRGRFQRGIPQCVDLHRLADARRDHAIADLRIHPRQLHAGLAAVHSPSSLSTRIDSACRARILRRSLAAPERVRSRTSDHASFPRMRAWLRHTRARHRWCCIRARRRRRETDWAACPDRVRCEFADDLFGHRAAAVCEQQPRQRDHRIAAPVGEPRIARDDRRARRPAAPVTTN